MDHEFICMIMHPEDYDLTNLEQLKQDVKDGIVKIYKVTNSNY